MADDAPEQPDQEQPTVPVTNTEVGEPPTESTEPPASGSASGPRWVVVAVLALVLGVGGGFLLGRETAPDEGPTSLADAVSQTAQGDLPVGDLDLQELLQSVAKERGGALGQILGGDSGSGSGSKALEGLVGGLIDNLRDKLEQGDGSSSADSSAGSSSSAVLGVKAAAAPAGQTGVLVQEVAPGSGAADAGLQANDVITAVDSDTVASPSDLADVVQSHAPGDQVTVTFTRNGAGTTVKVRLGNASSTTTPPTTQAPTNA